MQFKQPNIYTSLERKFHDMDTAAEDLPAMPKQSSYSGTYGWQNSLPQIPKSDYPPSWDSPPWWKELDIEKIIGRTAIVVMALVTLGFGSIFIVKLLQFSIAFTLK